MFYKQFLSIINKLNSDFVDEFDYWIATLPNSKLNNITISLVSSKFGVSYSLAEEILKFACSEGILEECYLIICPIDDCGAVLACLELNDLANVLMEPQYCHDCGESIEISPNDIYVAYTRVLKPDLSESDIEIEISKKLKLQGKDKNFIQADLLGNKIKNMYKIFYNPDESAYIELKKLQDRLNGPFKTTKEKGDAYESLVLKIMKCIKFVSATNEIVTDSNQFDCTVGYHFSTVYPTVFNYMTPYFVVECKNEKKSPSNSYFHKISNIIDTNEAKLGIVFSRKAAGAPAKKVSYHDYLAHMNTPREKYLISFSDDDLDLIIKKRVNFLEYLNWKIQELTIGSTNGTFEMFKLED